MKTNLEKQNMNTINQFSRLSLNESQKLVGGFSEVFTLENTVNEQQEGANNCKGGNCAAATCNQQKPKKAKGKNSNCVGNCVSGCGTKK